MNKITVHSQRLAISPRNLEEMLAVYANETAPEMKQAYKEMIEEMRKIPGKEEWASEWDIHLPDGETVGGIGFKGFPDAQGTVEIGYGIPERHRCNGYATEAVGAIVRWAMRQESVRCVTAQTEPDNRISQKILLKNGFVRDGEGEEGPLFKIWKRLDG